MQILITGGTGLIGRQLCKALLAEGHELTVFSRNPASVPEKCGSGVRAFGTLGEWRSDKPFDAIINLAGEPIIDAPWTEARKKVLWDSRVALTQELVKHIVSAAQKPKVLLSGSAVGYYGNSGDREMYEADSPGNDFPAQLCKAWEDAARVAEQAGVRVCLLRTGLILSNDGGLLARMVLPFKLGMGARLGGGKQWMSWVHIDDYVAMALRLLHDGEASGPYNMTAPRPATNAEFTAALASALRRPALFAAPTALLKAALGERAIMALEGQKVLPGKMTDAGYCFQFPTLDRALGNLFGT